MTYPKPKRRQTLAQVLTRLDVVFSRWVRLTWERDHGAIECYTCRKPLTYDDAQAGHYISRRYVATRYNPMNVKPQCNACNCYADGRKQVFRSRLVEEHGEAEIACMEGIYREDSGLTADYYRMLIAYYEAEVKKIRAEM